MKHCMKSFFGNKVVVVLWRDSENQQYQFTYCNDFGVTQLSTYVKKKLTDFRKMVETGLDPRLDRSGSVLDRFQNGPV